MRHKASWKEREGVGGLVAAEGGEIQTLSRKQSNICSRFWSSCFQDVTNQNINFSPSVQHNFRNIPF